MHCAQRVKPALYRIANVFLRTVHGNVHAPVPRERLYCHCGNIRIGLIGGRRKAAGTVPVFNLKACIQYPAAAWQFLRHYARNKHFPSSLYGRTMNALAHFFICKLRHIVIQRIQGDKREYGSIYALPYNIRIVAQRAGYVVSRHVMHVKAKRCISYHCAHILGTLAVMQKRQRCYVAVLSPHLLYSFCHCRA